LRALAAGHLPHHATPNEAAVAVVKVPDDRLDRLAVLVNARKTTYIEARILDFPSFSVGKKGPPAQLLGSLSTSDLLVHVIRAFSDESLPDQPGGADPARDVAALDLELALADLGAVERRIERVAVEMRSLAAGARGAYEREMALLERLKTGLEAEVPIRAQDVAAPELATLSGFNFLTAKPLLVVLNVAEEDASRAKEMETDIEGVLGKKGIGVIALAAKAEADLTELSEEEALEFRRELGLPPDAASGRLLLAAMDLLGQISFFTAGPQDTHAWSVAAGTPAVKAAGKIHSDIERGFIRAEVIGWQEYLECGSLVEAKRRGLLRVEGKTYIVQDGDVINVLFNV
jgi:ribosome-binding ATPase